MDFDATKGPIIAWLGLVGPTSEDGVTTMTDACVYDDAAAPADVLFVPGGLGTRALQHDATGPKEQKDVSHVETNIP